MIVFDFLFSALSVNKVRQHVHGAGAVECDHGDEIFDARHANAPNQVAHAAAFELEHADRVAAAKQVVRFLVIKGQPIEVDIDVLGFFNQVDGFFEDGKRFEPEEIHFQ